jgi:hypothetical protein
LVILLPILNVWLAFKDTELVVVEVAKRDPFLYATEGDEYPAVKVT